MSERRRRIGLAAAAAAVAVALTLRALPSAAADDDEGEGEGDPRRPAAAAAAAQASVEIVPVFSAPSTTARFAPIGWNDMLVRVQNRTNRPLQGEVLVTDREFAGREPRELVTVAPFTAPASGAIHVRLPIDVAVDSSLFVEVRDASGAAMGSATFTPMRTANVTLVDVSEPSRVRDAVGDVPVTPSFTPSSPGRGGGSGSPTLSVVSPRFDPATGDPILPDRAATYAAADAVIVRSDVLARVAGGELEALARYVIGGGTLAIAIARPEDLRHPTLTSFAGGAITKGATSAVTLQELAFPVVSSGPGGAGASKSPPWARNPSDDTLKSLAGYSGGNLHGSPYGYSAAYGLGEVHVLAFDPTRQPALDDPWARARVVDLARRGFDRRASLVFRATSSGWARDGSGVRKQLDPNESSRWAIAAAALLLCVYAVLAGPFNFSRASKAGKPLRALLRLPIYAAVAFACVVGIGVAVKGVRGRARHLTLVDAGAGMTEGAARRYRGFYAARSEKLTIRTSDHGSVLRTDFSDAAGKHERLVVDRDGARLVDVAALPWQTLVVREDGTVPLGEGIAIAADGEADVTVTNRTNRALRAAILKLPTGRLVYFGAIADGAKVSSRTAKAVDTMPGGKAWAAAVKVTSRPSGVVMHALSAGPLAEVLDPDAPGVADAWRALEDVASNVDWLPDGTPVLLAQIDGGEGRRADAGLRVESDRLLVRVLGYGGRP